MSAPEKIGVRFLLLRNRPHVGQKPAPENTGENLPGNNIGQFSSTPEPTLGQLSATDFATDLIQIDVCRLYQSRSNSFPSEPT